MIVTMDADDCDDDANDNADDCGDDVDDDVDDVAMMATVMILCFPQVRQAKRYLKQCACES